MNKDKDPRKDKLEEWNIVSGPLLRCLRKTAQIAIGEGRLLPEALHKYQKSGILDNT